MNNISLDNLNDTAETILVSENFYIQRNIHSVYQVMLKSGGQCFGSYNLETAKKKMNELEKGKWYL